MNINISVRLFDQLACALEGCVDELNLHEKMARDTGDSDLLRRLKAARKVLNTHEFKRRKVTSKLIKESGN